MLISDEVSRLRPLTQRGLLQHPPRAEVIKPEKPRHTPKVTGDSHYRRGKHKGEGEVVDAEGKKLESSGDKFVAQYLFFLKSLAEESEANGDEPEIDPQQLERELAELEQSLAQGSDSADSVDAVRRENIEAFAFSAQIEYSESSFLGYVSDGSSAAFAASFEAHLKASFEGEIVTSNGTRLSVSASIQVDVSVSMAAVISAAEQAQPQRSDPLALDLDGNGELSLTGIEDGATFDINADSLLDRTAFVSGNDAFLALDRNANGQIDDGGELFGDQNGAANGFLELSRFDDDRNGLIDSNDSVFSALRGVRLGADGNLVSSTLAELGVQSIGLGYQNISQLVQGNNLLSQLGSYRTSAGEERNAYDANLIFRPLSQRV